MRRCPACRVAVEGDWERCPLCRGPVHGHPTPSPLGDTPLGFSRRRVLKVLFLVSLAVIAASLAAQLLLRRGVSDFGVLRSVWLGVSAMWLLVLMGVRKRRNLAKGTVYLVVLVGLIAVYWDYLTGWHGWALTYAVPIVCASAIVAVLIIVRVMRTEVGDHIVYSGLTVLLGLAPLGFLLAGWVTQPLPSALSGALSIVVAVLLLVALGPDVRHELRKRLHL